MDIFQLPESVDGTFIGEVWFSYRGLIVAHALKHEGGRNLDYWYWLVGAEKVFDIRSVVPNVKDTLGYETYDLWLEGMKSSVKAYIDSLLDEPLSSDSLGDNAKSVVQYIFDLIVKGEEGDLFPLSADDAAVLRAIDRLSKMFE